ncbi:MAG: hypothetical protein CSA82_02955 [Actinobacteria bacterium]|nr:MAG: hypothetical protein CSA82_02955 [Actinomycetota bacterium]
MMNFRYHLVSLIAIFLALAVGIVLGAGPLQSRIYTAVNSPKASGAGADIDVLNQVQAQARAEAAGIEHISNAVLPSTLDGLNVVAVTLPGADPEDVAAARDTLNAAGAKVVGEVALTENWESQSKDQFRQTLATHLASYLEGKIPADATGDSMIGYAIVNTLTAPGPEQDVIAEILTDESNPILTFTEKPTEPVQSLVVIGKRGSAGTSEEDGEAAKDIPSANAWAGLAQAMTQAPKKGIIVGDASQDTAPLAQLRALGSPVSTVDNVGSQLSCLSMALALPQAASTVHAYGVGIGAEKVMPELPAR